MKDFAPEGSVKFHAKFYQTQYDYIILYTLYMMLILNTVDDFMYDVIMQCTFR